MPLNAYLLVVFSEPMGAGTAGDIQLLQAGAPVSGHGTATADGLGVKFQPDGLLLPNADYVLVIPGDVADLSGDTLQRPDSVEFLTDSTIAVARVATDAPALLVNPTSGELRTFEAEAVLHSDGRVTGEFSVYYAASGWRVAGYVTCLAIVNGNSAWVAGVNTEAVPDQDSVGLEWGWRELDNGPPEGGVPDKLSFIYPLATHDLGRPEDFCATTPVAEPLLGEIRMLDLIGGDIVVSGQTPLPPPLPPPGAGMSQIASAAYPGGGIKIRRADGSGVRMLTTDSGDFSPTWSPDGLRLAFSGMRGTGTGDIYEMSYDGSGVIRLTSDPSDDRDPAWSPDGSTIAFSRDGTIQLMDAADGSNVRKLTDGPDFHPTWAPDGSKLVFARAYHIYVVNANGTGVTQLTNGPDSDDTPAWSPDGTRIVFQRNAVISVMNADGTGVTPLAPGKTPAWSPDGTAIGYITPDVSGPHNDGTDGLMVMNADGSNPRRIGRGLTPVWSPVGTVPP